MCVCVCVCVCVCYRFIEVGNCFFNSVYICIFEELHKPKKHCSKYILIYCT